MSSASQSPTHKRKTYVMKSTSEDWFVTLEVNGTKPRFKIDSGSQVNTIPRKDYQLLKIKPGLKPHRKRLTTYNGTSIPVLGKCAVQILYKNNTYDVPIIIADTDASPILGLKTSFPQFWGTRDISKVSPYYNGSKYKTLTLNPPRKVPFALKQRLKYELQRMTQLDIIIPVNISTDWVSSRVEIEKSNGNLRVCLDPQNLNKAIEREHHRLLTATDIFQEMAGAL